MRHDILSRPKETAKLDIYSGSIYHAEDLGGAFVFVESNRDVGWQDPATTPWCFGSVMRPFFNDSCVGQRSCVYSTSRQFVFSCLHLHYCYGWVEVRAGAVTHDTGLGMELC